MAALATLAILRVIAVSSPPKDNEKFQVKCITFSQPPVGNAALREYVAYISQTLTVFTTEDKCFFFFFFFFFFILSSFF